MPRRGAKPKPTKLKRISNPTGGGSGGGINRHESMPSREISLEPPGWADMTVKAKVVWFRVAPIVHRNGLLTEADLEKFVRYCDALPRWYSMRNFIEEYGETYEVLAPVYEGQGRDRQVIDWKVSKISMRPQMKLYIELERMISNMEAEFGLSPSARTRIHAVEDEHEKEELNKYFG